MLEVNRRQHLAREPPDDAPASTSGNASHEGAYATVLETYRGTGGAKKSAGIEDKEALTQ